MPRHRPRCARCAAFPSAGHARIWVIAAPVRRQGVAASALHAAGRSGHLTGRAKAPCQGTGDTFPQWRLVQMGQRIGCPGATQQRDGFGQRWPGQPRSLRTEVRAVCLRPPLPGLLPGMPRITHEPMWLQAAPAMLLRMRSTRQPPPSHVVLPAMPSRTHPPMRGQAWHCNGWKRCGAPLTARRRGGLGLGLRRAWALPGKGSHRRPSPSCWGAHPGRSRHHAACERCGLYLPPPEARGARFPPRGSLVHV